MSTSANNGEATTKQSLEQNPLLIQLGALSANLSDGMREKFATIYQKYSKLAAENSKSKSKAAGASKWVHPFMFQWNIRWYHWILLCINSLWLAPLRLIGVAITLSLSILLTWLGTVGISESYFVAPDVPLRPSRVWRYALLHPLIRVMTRSVYWCAGIHWVRVIGRRATRKEAPIIVMAPHSSVLDSFIVAFLGMNTFVGKTESARTVFGSLIKYCEPILVNREDPHSRQNTVAEIKRRCTAANQDWSQILIFAEGTTTNQTSLIQFRIGAFAPAQSVQPLLIRWNNSYDTLSWTWEGPNFLILVWLTLASFNTNLELEYLEPYTPNEEECRSPKLFARNVRSVMARAIRLPTVDLSYADCRLTQLARKYELPFAPIIIELNHLCQSLFLTKQSGGPSEREDAASQSRSAEEFVEELRNKLDDTVLRGAEMRMTQAQFARMLLPAPPHPTSSSNDTEINGNSHTTNKEMLDKIAQYYAVSSAHTDSQIDRQSVSPASPAAADSDTDHQNHKNNGNSQSEQSHSHSPNCRPASPQTAHDWVDVAKFCVHVSFLLARGDVELSVRYGVRLLNPANNSGSSKSEPANQSGVFARVLDEAFPAHCELNQLLLLALSQQRKHDAAAPPSEECVLRPEVVGSAMRKYPEFYSRYTEYFAEFSSSCSTQSKPPPPANPASSSAATDAEKKLS